MVRKVIISLTLYYFISDATRGCGASLFCYYNACCSFISNAMECEGAEAGVQDMSAFSFCFSTTIFL
jgi:hypothetical protein